jgi:hypothetical protein
MTLGGASTSGAGGWMIAAVFAARHAAVLKGAGDYRNRQALASAIMALVDHPTLR